MDRTSHASDGSIGLRFWGVRGSTPTPVARNLGYGGNTACVEILQQDEDAVHILDAGSGIRALGAAIAARPQQPGAIHIFFTHFHWDHLQGLPFFAPLFAPHSRIVFHSVHPPQMLHEILSRQMAAPFFPVDFSGLAAQLEFRQIASPQSLGSVTLETFPLHHPQGSVGYRISDARRTLVYATDHEHGNAAMDRSLSEVARDADVLVHDAQYTPGEYPLRKGWGHSTWQEATAVAAEAKVAQLVLFHHDPDRDDRALDEIVALARHVFPQTVAARELMTV
jgi:phosphoribosyl 1,2-cyclic phosphodiesterase